MSKYYVIKNRDSSFEEYALFVADRVDYNAYDCIRWKVSSTDNVEVASKFRLSIDAFNLIPVVGLNKNDWEVILYEEGN